MKPKKLIPFSFLILTAFILLGYFQYRSYIQSPIDKNDTENVSFQIKKGQTAKEIGKNLEEKGLIKSSWAFYLYTKTNQLGEGILAGRFLLNRSMNVPEIITNISDPQKAEFIITIQEGIRIKDIDDKLVELDLIKPGEFTTAVKNFDGWQYYSFLDKNTQQNLPSPLEGYLYPDTYFLDPGDFEPKDLIYLALDNFEDKIRNLKRNGKYNFHQIITMASILEQEVRGSANQKIVAGILWKRLKNGWTLGADATLLYLSNDRKITSADLQADSPYNTRKNQGLPPGPIGNPGITSIEAALSPTETDYWFYLTTLDTGEVIYSKTNEEHNLNREKYL